ncbi:Two component regulator propeller [Bryocella elongata]|uniref:Two component regulator propeller n=1 Tax=Bryocella elongata TaxID=863522 RepID=A0A1H6C9T7_9BACT|nr:sensor histidine kinase [Bryocella elongata]SEG69136.1 Two component regulator propeller [Bryocella elongata]
MNTKKLLLIFFAFVAFVQPLLALNPDNRISQYGHAAWRVQDGAIGGNPNAFAQTPDGYLWVGTPSGLYRYDGASFLAWNPPPGQHYPFAIANITALYTARDGSLWIGGGGGLSHWANGKFTSVDAPIAEVEGIAEDGEGAIWITRSHMHQFTGPLCKVSADIEQCFGESSGIQSIAAGPIATDAHGRFWIAGVGSVIEWQGKLIREHFLSGARSPDSSRLLNTTMAGGEGIVWTGESRTGPRDGLQRLSDERWSPYTAPGFNGANVAVNTLFLDQDHCLWIGTENQGIYRIHGQNVDHFGHDDGLSSNFVTRIFQDHEGGIWIATSEGLDHFRDLPIVTYSSVQGVSADYVATMLARRDGSVTIASDTSMSSIHASVVTPLKMPPWMHGHPTAMLEDDRGNLWIGGDGGLRVQAGGQWHVVTGSALMGDDVRSLAEATDHTIWAEIIGLHPRLLRIENYKVREEFKPPHFPAAFFVVTDPHGGVWLSFLDGRLMHYQTGQWQELSMEPLVRKYSRIGTIFNISFDSDGTLWGVANGGVIGYRHGRLQLLNERNGLPCARTYAALADLHGDLWLSTVCGLMRIKHSDLERWWADPESRFQVSPFQAIDGFRAGIPLSHPAAVRSTDGKLWFHNNSVVMMIDPDHLPYNTVVPPVHVEQVIADRKVYGTESDLRLPPRTHQVEFDYAGLSFVAPSKVLFRYMLEGYDTQWQEPGTRRAAFYNDLPPGNYTFHVIACNNSGLWNKAGASMQLRVAPAYYQTNLFRVMCGAIVVALFWVFYLLRLRQMQQEFAVALEARVKERTRIARELHDTLLQSLHGLMFKFQAARNMLPRRPEDAMQTLDKAISETEQAIAESREAIHDLRSEPLSEQDLATLLEGIGEELAALQDTNHKSPSFRVIVEGDPQKLYPELQGEVYRIAREVLRNAFWHAGASQVEAEIRYDKNQLRLRIRDDGKGIDPKVLEESRRPGHWGLPGVRERAIQIGAQLSFWSQDGAGTEIEVTIPATVAYEEIRKKQKFAVFRRERKL